MGHPPRWLIVVADNEPILSQGLRLSFANDPSVEVVVDRRGAEPRPSVSDPRERRHSPSPEQSVVWRELKFLLVDRWQGMTVYEASGRQAPAR
jgi:hypothetical protein